MSDGHRGAGQLLRLCDRSVYKDVGMKRSVILLCDIIVSFIVFGWSLLGPWDRLLGFDVYHSRGDVWLPTPPAAAAFFRSMVSTGSLLFAIFFLVASVLIFFLRRSPGASSDPKGGPIFFRTFDSDPLKLGGKYSAVLFISFISPFFYNFMRRFHFTRSRCIVGGFAITLAILIVVFVTAELAARIVPRRAVQSFC